MVKIVFRPSLTEAVVEDGTKILVAARRHKIPIRFGCASCRCGTCGVRVSRGSLSPMKSEEIKLLKKMGLPTDQTVRLACQARVMDGQCEVDLTFQNEYDPDDFTDADSGDSD